MKKRHRHSNTICLLIVTLLALLTIARNSIWHRDYTIWKDTTLKSPDKARAYNNFGGVAERERLFDDAVWAYKRAIGLYKKDMIDPSPSMNAHYNLGLMYIEMGKKKDAIKIFRNLFSIGLGGYYTDDAINALIERLDTLFNKGKGIHSGDVGLDTKLRMEIYNSLGATYLAAGLNDLAVLMFQKSLKYDPQNAEILNNMGAAYLKRGYLDASIKEFEKAVKINPELAAAYSNMGFAYFDKGDYKSAVNWHIKAVEIDPYYANAHYGIASVYEKFGDKGKAIQHWKEYLRLAPQSSPWAEEARRHINEIGMDMK